jgi:type I pantothenate kinase
MDYTSLPSRYLVFDRTAWQHLRGDIALTLNEADLDALRGLGEQISLDEVIAIYLPLTRLLHLHIDATRRLQAATGTFLNRSIPAAPYVIGMAGSVAVGKSTTARILQALLARQPDHPRVDLVTTDGFLYPNSALEARGLMGRKGFPESYDRRRLIGFLLDLKAGTTEIPVPVYSHEAYDILPDHVQIIQKPDIVIVEGLNVLQTGPGQEGTAPRLFASDFFDFSIYVDAGEALVETWYITRFLQLRDTVFQRPTSYFHRYAGLTEAEAIAVARDIWQTINAPNLRENIAPTRERAHLILTKGADHHVQEIRLRRL